MFQIKETGERNAAEKIIKVLKQGNLTFAEANRALQAVQEVLEERKENQKIN